MRMIKVGICDDLEEELEIQKNIVQNIMKELCVNAEVLCFQSGEDLLYEIEQKGKMDIILMDIEMKGMNGVETAKIIRKNDFSVILIFISHYDQYCKEMISVQPFSFIDKPISEKDLKNVIAHAVELRDIGKETFKFTYKKVTYSLLLGNIRYFESHKREIHVHDTDTEGKYLFYGKLDDVEEKLKQSDVKFIRVNKSFLISELYIKEFRYNKIILDNDIEIGIGPKYRDIVKKYYISSMGN